MTDSCPSCTRRGVAPARVRRRGGEVVAVYRCRCGHAWCTRRSTAHYSAADAA